MPKLEGLGEGIECTDQLTDPRQYSLLQSAWENLKSPFDKWLLTNTNQAGEPVTSCIVADLFGNWAYNVAAMHGVPLAVFNTSGPFGDAVFHCIKHTLQPKSADVVPSSSPSPFPTTFYDNGDDENRVFVLEGFASPLTVHRSELPENIFTSAPFFSSLHDKMNKCWMVIFNSFYEFDKHSVDLLRKKSNQPVLCIGPLLRQPSEDTDDAEWVKWLDSRDRGTVAYVCFGSQGDISEEQSLAVAEALEHSGVGFLWAMKCGVLPDGFEERTKEKGRVVRAWVDQMRVLRHDAVGAFVSHCGWNSTLESVSMGVPLVGLPVKHDQPFNAKLLQWLGLGIDASWRIHGMPNTGCISAALRTLICIDKGDTSGEASLIRERVRKLSDEASKALSHGGSSLSDLQFFISQARTVKRIKSNST